MTVENKEWLSALMDGAPVTQESLSQQPQTDEGSIENGVMQALEEIDFDAVDKDTWSRYHLIGDVMRGETPSMTNSALIDSIEAALDEEATLVSFEAQKTWRQTLKQRTVSVFNQAKSSSIVRISSQAAIAATVAVVAVVGVQQDAAVGEANTTLPVLQTSGPIVGSAEPVSLSTPNIQQQTHQQEQQEEQRRRELLMRQQRVSEMLLDHQQRVRRSQAELNKRSDEQQRR